MADAGSSIFNRRAVEKLRSPDDLDKYVQVTNPSVWIVLGACVALLAGLLAWGVFGAVSTSVTTTGVVVDIADARATTAPVAVCLLDAEDAAKVHVGDPANVGGESMTVGRVDSVPSSAEEAKDLLGSDFLVNSLMKGDWAYVVYFDGDTSDLAQNMPVSVTITVDRVAPISLILKNQG